MTVNVHKLACPLSKAILPLSLIVSGLYIAKRILVVSGKGKGVEVDKVSLFLGSCQMIMAALLVPL